MRKGPPKSTAHTRGQLRPFVGLLRTGQVKRNISGVQRTEPHATAHETDSGGFFGIRPINENLWHMLLVPPPLPIPTLAGAHACILLCPSKKGGTCRGIGPTLPEIWGAYISILELALQTTQVKVHCSVCEGQLRDCRLFSSFKMQQSNV